MRSRILLVPAALALLALPLAKAQDLVNMREDLRLLNQRVGELALRVEQLERENSTLQRKAETSSTATYATLTQLNDAVAEINRTIRSSNASTRNEVLQIVAGQLEKLANQTNEAIESVARSGGSGAPRRLSAGGATATAPSAPASAFADNYPKEGISYTVVKGDTLAKIAAKTGSRSADIINANKISDPSKIQAGQVLFIPGGK